MSRWLVPGEAPVVRALWCEPGSVHVRVTDGGKAFSGVATVGTLGAGWPMTASLDERGEALFLGVRTCKHMVSVAVEGFEPVLRDFATHVSALPTDEVLLNRRAILPVTLTTRQNHRDEVELHPEAVGFVRGRVHGLSAEQLRSVWIYPGNAEADRGGRAEYDEKRGEFVAGPFPAGIAHLSLRMEDRALTKAEVLVKAGEVASFDFEADPRAQPQPNGAALFSVSGVTALTQGESPLRGRVLLSDGSTPAFGARLLYYPGGGAQPRFAGMVDARGAIQPRPLWVSMNAGSDDQDYPSEPTVVAMLPGRAGATVVTGERAKDLSVVLAQEILVRGKVTVGGQPVTGKPGRIRVLAARERTAAVEKLMSVETTADADGAFELAGLTPGRYRVQAALDDVWFSETVSFDTEEEVSAPLVLAIAEPGGSTTITLLGKDHSPVAGASVEISRPEGPLKQQFSPQSWKSDGAGRVFVPTLEAGEHVVKGMDGDGRAEMEVLAPTTGSLTIQLQR